MPLNIPYTNRKIVIIARQIRHHNLSAATRTADGHSRPSILHYHLLPAFPAFKFNVHFIFSVFLIYRALILKAHIHFDFQL